MKKVTITLSFPMPSDPEYSSEDMLEFWEFHGTPSHSPDFKSLREEIKSLFEDEFQGLADYNSVTVEKLEITDGKSS